MQNNELIDLLSSFIKDTSQVSSIDRGVDFTSSSLQSLALQLVVSQAKNPSKIAIALPTLYDLQLMSDYLSDFFDSEKIAIYPKDEILRLGNLGSSKEMNRERLKTLFRIQNEESLIVLYNATSSLTPIASPNSFEESTFKIEIGNDIDRDELLDKLAKCGYSKVGWVNNGLEYATRGSIIDIFSPAYQLPLRIELDDDKIISIRLFSPMTTRSETSLDSAIILPGSERPIGKGIALEGQKKILDDLKNIKFKTDYERDEKLRELQSITDSVINTGILSDSSEELYPYYDVEKGTIVDYLKGYKIFMVLPKSYYQAQNNYKEDEISYFASGREEGIFLPLESLYANPADCNVNASFINVDLNVLEADDGIGEVPVSNSTLNQSAILIDEAKKLNLKVYACIDEKTEPSYLAYLKDCSISYTDYPNGAGQVTLIHSPLIKGFRIKGKADFLSSTEIYGVALRKSRFLTRYKEFKPIKKYSDLTIGDYVVEEKNGIGIYRGIQQYKGLDRIVLEYAEHATLLIPIQNFTSIRKYSGSEAAHPSLDKIGGSTWARKKAKIKSRMTFLADKLLDIYAERERIQGIAYSTDLKAEEKFAKQFPYPLTSSQQKAWADISSDMEKTSPMDRLIAGDVGFGKTELAFKAMFKAVINGYQAALLCPTTILSRQHYEVAKERFEDFGIKIGILNRFNSSKEEKKTLSDLAEGKIDIIIGTHRLLSQDVKFKELGLLVVDEEQKFGVAQKERIKDMTHRLDVLSLSATPIPRTLQMSLLTIRPMSTLDDAPSNRLPVKTYVCKESEGLIKEVIARELARNGQVYFLHNRIDTIYSTAGKIKKLFPIVTVGVAHGAMDAAQIADVMNDFYDKKIEILVSTSIIESGLDVTNCNTILVEDAQNFGLSQLYQIKGRVGRSNRLAYAYLLYSNYDKITDDGRKRLKAIKDFAELGAGYKIAQQDLAIRGSGNILGSEQAGFVDTLGYEAYTKLLKEVIEQKRASLKGVKLAEKHPTRFNLTFSLEAHIPSEYANATDRINLYRELEDCTQTNEVYEFMNRVRDTFGPYPREVKNLFKKRLIEIGMEREATFLNFEELMEGYKLTMSETFSSVKNVKEKMEKNLSIIVDSIREIRFSNRHFIIILKRTPNYIDDLFYLVDKLIGMSTDQQETIDIFKEDESED